METALTASISVTKTAKALSTPATSRLTNPATLAPSWHLNTSKRFDLYAYSCTSLNPRSKTSTPFITYCCTKPNTDSSSASETKTGLNSTVETNSNAESKKQEPPTLNPALSSPNSSFSRGLMFDLGPKNSSWDSLEIGSPVVKRFLSDEEERWYMWYHGNSGSGSDTIGLAVSSNGIHWERGNGPVRSSSDVGLVLNCSNDWWAFDTESIRPSEVVIMSSSKVRANSAVYWLYYSGCNSEKIESLDSRVGFRFENPERVHIGEDVGIGKAFKSLPGLAMSQDGRHWARIEGEHHSGALFDVGFDGEWDSMFIASPQVVFHRSGDLRMYYHSFDVEKRHFAVGMARSRDGMKWVKLGKIIGGGGLKGGFDEFGAVNARVVKIKKSNTKGDGEYAMAYEGVDAYGRRCIGLAVSSDGLKDWRRVQNGPLLKWSDEGGWDDKGVGSPCLVQMGGEQDEWRLYYRGTGKEGQMGIGMAVSEGSDITSFRRWMGFHL